MVGTFVRYRPVILLALTVLLFTTCTLESASPNEIRPGLTITRTKMGSNWPFTVEHGVIRCIGANGIGEVYFVTPDNTIYAVNDRAVSKGKQQDIRTASIYTGKDLMSIIDGGLDLCQ
jgi:hypothetical protein